MAASSRRPAKPAKKPAATKSSAKKVDANPTRIASKRSAKTAKRAKIVAKPAGKTVRPANTAVSPSATASKPAARSSMKPASGGLLAVETQLRAHAMAKPEATEHFPWGERAIKVKGKVFLFMRADAQQLSLSTKLPQSGSVALLLPFATPTGYGLGKAGWVSAAFGPSDPLPVDMLCSWIDESYQAVAPAKLAALARSGE